MQSVPGEQQTSQQAAQQQQQGAAQPPPQHAQHAQQGPPCWYAVLGVLPGASAEEIRRAYRLAALRLHPDKAGGAGSGSGEPDGPGGGAAGAAQFVLVQRAWEVLQGADSRAAYDRQRALAAAAQQLAINETVDLPDMDLTDVEGLCCHAWPCRCGGSYLLAAEDAAAAAAGAAHGESPAGPVAELLVPCSTCSLHIRVLLACAAET